jgi:cell division transport system permease protein
MLKDNAPQQKKTGPHGAQLQPSFKIRSQAYVDTHVHALFSSLGRLMRTPTAFLMTLLVLAISMALSSSFYLIVKNFQQLTGNVASTNQITVYLKPTVNTHIATRLMEDLKQNALVESVQLVTSEQALAEFKANSNFSEAVDALKENPLPPVLLVLPKNALEDEQTSTALLDIIAQRPEVDIATSDQQWVDRLRAIIGVAKRVVWLFSLLFGLAVLLIIGNTIRLELQDRREEVLITQLVGATHAFVRRPFLYAGFWLGFLASIAAWFIVTIFMLFLRQPVQVLSAQYASQFNLVFLDYAETFALIGIASLLGVLGAWWVLGSQLRALKPE